jgi:2-oxo-hept-3-ene-1,7-dioate hydratase
MMSEAERKNMVRLLLAADKEHKPIELPSKLWPGITIDDAYAIQSEMARQRVAAGAKVIGHKIGLTSKAMQRSSQIDEPDYGHLFDYMLHYDGVKLPFESFCVPRVEIELAFIMGRQLSGSNVGLIDALRATEYVVPSIEIIDQRVGNPRKIFDTVSDNGGAAAVVLGGRPVRSGEVDLRWVGGMLYRNSEIEETGVAAGVLGHPALGVAWLARKLARFDITLKPGHIVLSGSFTRPVWAQKGDTLRADFGKLGAVSVQFI